MCVCVCLCFSKVECAVCKEKLSKLFGKAGYLCRCELVQGCLLPTVSHIHMHKKRSWGSTLLYLLSLYISNYADKYCKNTADLIKLLAHLFVLLFVGVCSCVYVCENNRKRVVGRSINLCWFIIIMYVCV